MRCYHVLQLEQKERKNFLYGPVWALLANDGSMDLQRMHLFLQSLEGFGYGALLDTWLDELLEAAETKRPDSIQGAQRMVAEQTRGWRSELSEGHQVTLTTFTPVALSPSDEEERLAVLGRRRRTAAQLAPRESSADPVDRREVRLRPRLQ